MKFSAAFSVIASAALAVAQSSSAPPQTSAPAPAPAMTMNTPAGVMECYNTLLTWTGGTPPYQITVLPGGQPNATPLETLPSTNDLQQTWQCKQAAGTSIFFHLKELSSGKTVDSGAVTVQPGNSTLCGTSSGSSSAPAASSDAGTTPPVAPTTNAPNAPTTSAAASTGTNKPQSSNNSKTSSGAASSPTTQSGAGQLQAPVALAGAAAFAMALFA